jgi:hypothetical protein
MNVLSMSCSAGDRAGKHWADHSASPAELARLEAFYVQSRDGLASFAHWFDLEPCAPWSHADIIAAAVMGFDGDHQFHAEAVEFADSLFGEDETPDDEFLCGFVCGALNTTPDA